MSDNRERAASRSKFEWTSHPWAEEGAVRRWTLVGSIAIASTLAGYSLGSIGIALLSAALLVAGMARYFFPTSYRVDSSGVRMRFLAIDHVRHWSRFRRVAKRQHGVFLGTFDRPRRIDSFRGWYLRSPGFRDSLYEYARQKIVVDADARADASRVRNA